ncbi:MAG TPA: sterol desaturase family protein [Tahibacter sp.]|uniref:sterol desaturase family protein n=1 Tax=Tahibacter sp. TaxID=2056211 RepID=UPI002BF2B9F8|nr:sterol desaturase family protein [Tahibacter sp.]HSX60172.1 sterol desaturase family protein [Tahibacter sp.]
MDTLRLLDLVAIAASALIVVLLPVECWRYRRQSRLDREHVLEMLASASPFVPTVLMAPLVTAFIAALWGGAARLAPWSIPTTGWTALLALLAVDFLYYWDHRAAHRVRLIWAVAHSVHHSSPLYNQAVGLRVSFVDGFTSPWFYLPAILVGFDPLLVAGAFGVILAYQQWLHTETVGKLPWLDGWLNTPSNHRVHHGVQAPYIDRNYGAVLMLWDRLFGTYAAEDEPVRYGLTEPLASRHPLRVHAAEAVKLWHDLHRAPCWRDRVQMLVSPP